MPIVLCPGVHSPTLTQAFQQTLRQSLAEMAIDKQRQEILVFPTDRYPAYSAIDLVQFLQRELNHQAPILFIAFSAGVVGAIAAAWQWQQSGGRVLALIALDGWGVPLHGSFPIHRISHDYFTHWSSAWLGAGEDSFYADPAINHLDLWRSTQTVRGWWVTSTSPNSRRYTTQATFLSELFNRYLCLKSSYKGD
jgi:hypothetical protein